MPLSKRLATFNLHQLTFKYMRTIGSLSLAGDNISLSSLSIVVLLSRNAKVVLKSNNPGKKHSHQYKSVHTMANVMFGSEDI